MGGHPPLEGISYYAINQWQVASLQPPHLAAMCVWEGAAGCRIAATVRGRDYEHAGAGGAKLSNFKNELKVAGRSCTTTRATARAPSSAAPRRCTPAPATPPICCSPSSRPSPVMTGQFDLPRIGRRLDVGFFSRRRAVNPDSSLSVTG